MTVESLLDELKGLRDEKIFKHNQKSGAPENQFGVRLGDLRKIAKKIKTNHEFALELWKTGNVEARFIAILILSPKKLSMDEMYDMVCTINFSRVADWFNTYVVKTHPDKEVLRVKWMQAKEPMAARSGWHLTSIAVVKNPSVLNFAELLDRLDTEMLHAPELVQWTMNYTLAEIGIHSPEHRAKALEIGERLELYKDYPTAKGCTSPFAPIWINEMVSRQNKK